MLSRARFRLVMAEEVADGPVMTGEAAAARYLRLKTGQRRREYSAACS